MGLEYLDSDFERAKYFQNLLVARATGADCAIEDYETLRRHFLSDSRTKSLVPSFVRTNRDLAQFWQYIKHKFDNYHSRRQYIYKEFEPILDFLEAGGISPSIQDVSDVLSKYNSEEVQAVWAKAVERSLSDPEGAITSARTLLETICKHILDSKNVQYGESPDINKLYRLVAKELRLSPEQHSEETFKQILGGCVSVVNGLGSLRNKLGDAHGKGRGVMRPSVRHAKLAVNLSGAMAVFLVETFVFRSENNE